MEIETIKNFIKNFNINNQIIEKFFKNKNIINKNNNLFLTSKKTKKSQVFTDNILFIKLYKNLPTKYFLNFISKNSENIYIKNEKKALMFTYSKNLNIDDITNKPFKQQKYYIIKYKNLILGYIKIKDNKIINLMNIGEYLKENKN